MDEKYSITDISESNPVIWDALVEYEDGHGEKAWAMVLGADLTAADMAIFEDEVNNQNAKWAREAEYTETPRGTEGIHYSGPSPVEGMILARQGY